MDLLLKNGRIVTMAGSDYEQGDLLIHNGKIKELAPKIMIDSNKSIQIMDVSGYSLYPGLIEAHCHIGITEERKGQEGDDANEGTNPVTPYLRALDAINPLDAAFSKAVEAGITSVMVGPGSANVIGGQFLVMKTAGSRKIDDLIIKQPAAMKLSFGENPKTLYGDKDVMPSTRMAITAMIREELTKAQDYFNKRRIAQKKKESFEKDFRMECWVPVFDKEIPLKCHAHRTDDIFTAIRIAKEFNLDITLDHCSEGHLIAEEIKESGFPCIVGPDLASRSKIEVENMAFKTAGILSQKGILVSVTTDHPVSLIQSLPLCAGLAAKNGLGMGEGLKAITINAAKICRVEDRIGSLEVGKDADIAIFDGHPMELFSHCMTTIINGNIVYQYHKPQE